ncbi:MAG: putative phage tail protein [Clostridia bacterium]
MSELSETLLNTPMAKQMIAMISPIYENSYVALWMIKVIAQEFQRIQDALDALPDQFTPDTATWAIGLWEERYGIKGDSDTPLDIRRAEIAAKRSIKVARNPERFRAAIQSVAGVCVRIDEHYSAHTFAVYLQSASRVSEDAINRYIRRMKPAHLSYVLLYEYYSSATQYHAGVITWFGCVTIKQVY